MEPKQDTNQKDGLLLSDMSDEDSTPNTSSDEIMQEQLQAATSEDHKKKIMKHHKKRKETEPRMKIGAIKAKEMTATLKKMEERNICDDTGCVIDKHLVNGLFQYKPKGPKGEKEKHHLQTTRKKFQVYAGDKSESEHGARNRALNTNVSERCAIQTTDYMD